MRSGKVSGRYSASCALGPGWPRLTVSRDVRRSGHSKSDEKGLHDTNYPLLVDWETEPPNGLAYIACPVSQNPHNKFDVKGSQSLSRSKISDIVPNHAAQHNDIVSEKHVQEQFIELTMVKFLICYGWVDTMVRSGTVKTTFVRSRAGMLAIGRTP